MSTDRIVMLRLRKQSGRGFTLIEALLTASLLAVVTVAVTMPFVAGMQNEAEDARRTEAVNLASELMETIVSANFTDIGDYDDSTEQAGSIVSSGGNAIADPATAGLSREVSTQYVTVSGQDPSAQQSFVRVTVNILHDGRPLVSFTRLVYELPL